MAPWHAHECAVFMGLPTEVRQGGDTSMTRMLLRYKAVLDHGEWCGAGGDAACAAAGKEAIGMLETLQAIDTTAGGKHAAIAQLSSITNVPMETCETLIHRVRNNAASLVRKLPGAPQQPDGAGAQVGCALSVLMGYTNHSCKPNTVATIEEDGFVVLRAVEPIGQGEEALISYIDSR